MWKQLVSGLVLLACAQLALASSSEKKEVDPNGFEYLQMKPAFVVNFGEQGRVAYLKTDISLRVKNPSLEAVQRNIPAVRHEIIMLLSKQSEKTLESIEQREALRKEALERIRAAIGEIEHEEHFEGVEDLLFTSFIVQR